MSQRDIILEKAKELLRKKKTQGATHSEIRDALNIEIKKKRVNIDSVSSYISNLPSDSEGAIVRMGRALYVLKDYTDKVDESDSLTPAESQKEAQSYPHFAQYLMDEEYCTKAVALGGRAFDLKWFTPDVIGIFDHQSGMSSFGANKLPFVPEVVSAEIKADAKDEELLKGFGQASSYLLFSHKVFLVIPQAASKAIKDRLEVMCEKAGLGLIIESPQHKYELVVSAWKQEPELVHLIPLIPKIEAKLKAHTLH